MKKIAAVIVTYNRKELLCECIKAVLAQKPVPAPEPVLSHKPFPAGKSIVPDILIIDNHSTDGTKEAIAACKSGNDRILYFDTGSNLGGAGGFQYGIRKGVELGYDYLWLMDDDCIPRPGALAALLKHEPKHPYGFLTSKVLWRDGSVCKMNVQRAKLTVNVSDFSKGQVQPVVMASFVSLFLRTDVVRELGLPIREFFIWTDDWEFTRRISRKYPCYLVTDSVVVHKSKLNIKADISSDTPDRLDRFYYLYRNDVFLYRREGLRGFLYECGRLSIHCVRVVTKSKDHKLKRLGKIFQGTAAGFRFHPEIEYIEEGARE